MAKLPDSGARDSFGTGAVRDVEKGKGRMDLVPLDIAAGLMGEEHTPISNVLLAIEAFKETKNVGFLYDSLHYYAKYRGQDIYTVILEVSHHYEDGAEKYGENNWQKGIPLHRYISSGPRHLMRYLRKDTDEPHDRAFVWNIMGAIWTMKHHPEMDDIGKDLVGPKDINALAEKMAAQKKIMGLKTVEDSVRASNGGIDIESWTAPLRELHLTKGKVKLADEIVSTKTDPITT